MTWVSGPNPAQLSQKLESSEFETVSYPSFAAGEPFSQGQLPCDAEHSPGMLGSLIQAQRIAAEH